MMLADMREKGQTDEKLKELITPENYERYKTISRPMTTSKIKGDFAIKTVSMQQGLVVPQDKVDDEIMTLQAQALQRGEKFKESEVRPKVQQTLERTMVLDWLQSHAAITVVEPKGEDDAIEEMLGQSPEELAAKMKAEEMAKASPPAQAAASAAKPKAAEAAEATVEAPAAEAVEAAAPTEAPAPAADPAAPASAPDGFSWGGTF